MLEETTAAPKWPGWESNLEPLDYHGYAVPYVHTHTHAHMYVHTYTHKESKSKVQPLVVASGQ